MTCVLALDQGGTKTAALVADGAGRILGAGYSGGACHAIDGMPLAMAMVMAACRQALQQAGLSLEQVGLVVAGMTGADWPEEYPLLQGALRAAMGAADVTVVNDCIIAFRAGTDSPCGAVLCAGTGLNAAVISPAGESFIYGYYIDGDDNGGTALGRLALRAVYNAQSGIGLPTRLTQAVLAFYGAASVDGVMRRAVAGQLGEPKALVPLLAGVVREGDPVAVGLVEAFGARLARYVVAGVARYGMLGATADVVLSGGVFKAGMPELRKAVARGIQAEAPGMTLVDARYEPVVGALLLGLDRLAGKSVPLASDAVAQSVARFGLSRTGA